MLKNLNSSTYFSGHTGKLPAWSIAQLGSSAIPELAGVTRRNLILHNFHGLLHTLHYSLVPQILNSSETFH